MNRIEKYDANFKAMNISSSDVEFFDAKTIDGALYGVYYCNNEKLYRRIPKEVADEVSDGVKALSYHTSGGRLKIKTNSPYLVIRAEETPNGVMHNMPISGQWGFSIKENGLFHGVVCPIADEIFSQRDNERVTFQGMRYLGEGEHDLTIYFPLYNGVKEVFIGVKKGAYVEKGSEYKYQTPVVFYGSSITQGGCVTASCNAHVNIVSEMLDTNVLNLGFAGNAKGEKIMADYLASLNPSVYVIEYDHNAPNDQHLQETHYPLYKTIRDSHPTTPIILVSRPDVDRDYFSVDGIMRGPVVGYEENADIEANRRINVIINTYNKGLENGDKNLYFINGATLIPTELRPYATIDTCHPNELGFYYMAKKTCDILKPLLEK